MVVFSHCSMSIGRMESMVITSPELPMFFGVFRRHSSLQLLSPSQFLVTWVCEGHQRHNPFFFSLRKGYNPWRLCKRLKIWWRQSCCFAAAETHTKLTFQNGRRQRSQIYFKTTKMAFYHAWTKWWKKKWRKIPFSWHSVWKQFFRGQFDLLQ